MLNLTKFQLDLLMTLTTKDSIFLGNKKYFFDELVEDGIALVFKDSSLNKNLIEKENKKLDLLESRLRIIHEIQNQNFIKILGILKKNNIEVIVLKGWALASLFYNNAHHRPKTDLDILISRADKIKIKQILESLGFHNPRGWEPKEIIDQFSMVKRIAQGLYLNIDVHLELTNDRLIQNIFSWELLEREKIKFSELDSYRLPNHLLLLHAIIHIYTHNINEDRIKIIWIYDAILITDSMEEREINKLIEVCGYSGLAPVILNFILFIQKFHHSINLDIIIQKLNTCCGSTKYLYLLEEPSKNKVILRNIVATKSLTAKITCIFELVIPPKEEIYKKYGTVSSLKLPYYYCKRIAFWLFKKTN